MVQSNKVPKRLEDVAPADLRLAVNELRLSDPDKIAVVERKVEALVHRLYMVKRLLTSSPDRQERLKRIRRIHNRLAALREDFDHADPLTAHTFGVYLAEPLAHILGPQGVAALYPEIAQFLPDQSGRDLDRALSRRRPGESYEEFNAQARATTARVAVDYCTPILSRLIKSIDTPLGRLLDIERGHKGGRPRDPYRIYVIHAASEIYSSVKGVPPPCSRTGPFVNFCAGILEAFGLETDNLDEAIIRYTRS